MNIESLKPVILKWASSTILPTIDVPAVRGALAAAIAVANASPVSVRVLLESLFPIAPMLGLYDASGVLHFPALSAGVNAYFTHSETLPIPLGNGRAYNITKQDAEALLAAIHNTQEALDK